jgi:energy-coupling factor transport system ATP-binding protein
VEPETEIHFGKVILLEHLNRGKIGGHQMGTEVKDFEVLKRTDTRKAAYAVVLVAMGVALAPYTSFPIGIAKVNPTQHFVNVIAALLLGPWWAVAIATIIAVLRNAMGLGTLLAFPGGMIGAFLAGLFYRYTRNIYAGAAGEILGTGFIAPVVSALFVAPVFMGKIIPLLALIPSFLASTLVGAVLGVLAVRLLERADIVHLKA